MADGSLLIDTKLDSSGLQKGLSKLGSLTAVAIGAVGAALGAAGIAAIKVGADFEAGMSRVEAISGATAGQLDQLTEKAKQVGADTKFSAGEAAQAFEYMAMAGWKTTDMLDGIDGVMALAAASGEDLALVSDIVTDAMTAFGLQASDSAHFADVLAKASASSNTNVGLMGATFKYVAPVAGALGYSIEDTALAIGLMASAGIKGEQAGTALRSTFTRLVKPPKDAAAAMDALGISAENSDGSMKPLRQTLDELRDSFAGLSESERASNAASIAGVEGMSGLLAIVNASEEDYNNLATEIDNSAGSAEKMAAVMQNNLQGAIEELGGSLETLGIEFYQSVDNPLKEIAQNATDYVNQITEAFKQGGISAAVEEIGGILAEVVTKVAEAAPALINTATSAIQEFLAGIQQNLPQIAQGAVEIITALANGIITLLPTIIETGIQLIVQLALGLAQALPDLMPAAMEAILTIVTTLLDNIDSIIDAAIAMIMALADGLIKALPVLIEKAPEIIQKLVDALVENIPKLVVAAAELIIALVKALLDNKPLIVKAAWEILGVLVGGLIEYSSNVTQAAMEIVKNIWDTLTSTDWISLGLEVIQGIISGIASGAGALVDSVVNAAGSMMDGAKDFLGIHSPSTLMRDVIGKNLVRGISVGVEQEAPALNQTVTEDMHNMVEKMKAAVQFEAMQFTGTMAATATHNAVLASPQIPQSSGFSGNLFGKAADMFVVREEADIHKIAKALYQEINKATRGKGGGGL